MPKYPDDEFDYYDKPIPRRVNRITGEVQYWVQDKRGWNESWLAQTAYQKHLESIR